VVKRDSESCAYACAGKKLSEHPKNFLPSSKALVRDQLLLLAAAKRRQDAFLLEDGRGTVLLACCDPDRYTSCPAKDSLRGRTMYLLLHLLLPLSPLSANAFSPVHAVSFDETVQER
jgi:hypothetical protein